ncbi:hypothetical protein HK104_002019 [Borealophlyctis nickersoniae]|nr:hypothetical protein HK104_002019 [Borealophlyctis nickersoniae]
MWWKLPASLLLLSAFRAGSVMGANEDLLLTSLEQMEMELAVSRLFPRSNLSSEARQQILHHYAPLVRLHPRDRWRPADPHVLYHASRRLEDEEGDGDEDDTDNFMYRRELGGTLFVPDHLREGLEVTGDAEIKGAKLAAQVVQNGYGNRTYLQYWTFFPVNGCQGFRIGTWDGLRSFVKERTENFEWCKMALHNGDWEHITIQLEGVWDGKSIDTVPKIDKVFFSEHSDGLWRPASSVSFVGTHPIAYAAMNSHANYPTSGTHKNNDDGFNFVSRIAPVLTLGAIDWIQIADNCDLQTDLFTYKLPPVMWEKFVQWRTWESGFWDLSERREWPEWAWFKGRWGQPIDQTNFTAPPEGVSARRQLYAGLRTAYRLGVLNKFVRKVDRAPKGPRQHKNWYHLDRPFDPR